MKKENYKILLKCNNCNIENLYNKKEVNELITKVPVITSHSKIEMYGLWETFFICKNCGHRIFWSEK